MLAALLFSGMELVGHFTLFSGICFVGRFKQFGWKRPVGQCTLCFPGFLESFFPGFYVWDPGGEFCGACAAPSLDGETQALLQFQRRQECRRCGDRACGQSSSRI